MKRGITPNFVQSLDGAHMTMVINDICAEEDINDFWAVHDCFGVHPSEADRLIEAVKRTFKKLHEKPLESWIKEINPDHPPLPDPTITIDDETAISDYLIN